MYSVMIPAETSPRPERQTRNQATQVRTLLLWQTHAQTHRHRHPHTNTHNHNHNHTHTHTRTHPHTCTRPRARTPARSHTRIHARMHLPTICLFVSGVPFLCGVFEGDQTNMTMFAVLCFNTCPIELLEGVCRCPCPILLFDVLLLHGRLGPDVVPQKRVLH